MRAVDSVKRGAASSLRCQAWCWAPACLACRRVPRVKVAVVLTLASKLKWDDCFEGSQKSATVSSSTRQVSARDRLLIKKVAGYEANLPFLGLCCPKEEPFRDCPL
uniref:Uncharacterized protein n=1 Tax=Catagonus wagneri TaxID=51154 RepID=A0A8C3WSN3_9CETA